MVSRLSMVALVCSIAAAPGLPARQADPAPVLAERVAALTRGSAWRLSSTIRVQFPTHHPQGMVRIGEQFLVSSVEVKVRTRPLPRAAGGPDRDTGEGVGHLFKFDATGRLLGDLRLGEGSMYHPGGIDFDGRHVWVPVAEYRPDSRSVVYRVDPAAMTASKVFEFADHVGGIVHDTDDGTLHGVSWGSRRLYRWRLGGDGTVVDAGAPPETLRTLNPSHYVDYQDCKYVPRHRMLCTGVAELRQSPDARPFRLGGMDLIDLRDGRPLHQVPIALWTPGGLAMTRNPVWVEPHASGLRAYFMPEDDTSRVYVYDHQPE